MTQVAADGLGLSLHRVRFDLDCDVIVAPPYPVVNGDVEHLDAAGHERLARAVFDRL